MGSKMPDNDGKNEFFLIADNQELALSSVSNIIAANNLKIVSGHDCDFTILINEQVISIVPKKELKLNNKKLEIGRMYIISLDDTIYINKLKLKIEQRFVESKKSLHEESYIHSEFDQNESSEVENELKESPPDITLEMKVDALKKLSIDDHSAKEDEIQVDQAKEQRSKKTVAKPLSFNTMKATKNSHKNLASPLLRILALILEVFIIIICHDYTSIDPLIYSDFISMLKFDVTILSIELNEKLIIDFMSYILAFIFLRVLSSLLLGRSLGQFFIGASVEGTVLMKRIKGFFRELIGIVTGPFIIFDIACLFGKRTFKELLTQSEVKTSGFLKGAILTLLSFSFLFIVWVYLPFINTLEDLDIRVHKSKSINSKEYDKFNNSSLLLGVNFSKELDVYPLYKVRRKKTKISLIPEFIILKNDKKITLRLEKNLRFQQTIRPLISKNYFSYKYPLLKDSVVASRVVTKVEQKKLVTELYEVSKIAFDLNLEKSFEYLFKIGPFFKNYISYRKNIEAIVEDPFSKVEVGMINDRTFLKFKTGNLLKLLEVNFQKSRVFAVSGKNVSEFLGDIDFIAKKISLQKNLLSVLDIASKEKISAPDFQQMMDINFEVAKQTLASKKYSQKLVLKNFDSLLTYLKLKRLKEKDLYNKFNQNMLDVKRALIDMDKEFFGIEDTFITKSEEYE
ncbi:MAG: hypothetical protein N4A33_00820 [Bacteriovoracaceae bacterium]|jgi:hypothetical protein|nr:hypothetical protein [Bacteriovoracaceae bacterium]